MGGLGKYMIKYTLYFIEKITDIRCSTDYNTSGFVCTQVHLTPGLSLLEEIPQVWGATQNDCLFFVAL